MSLSKAHGKNIWQTAAGSFNHLIGPMLGISHSVGEDCSLWNTTAIPGSSNNSIEPQSVPLLANGFARNIYYGGSAALAVWYVGWNDDGTKSNAYPGVGESLLDSFLSWNCGGTQTGGGAVYTIFGYQSGHVRYANFEHYSAKDWSVDGNACGAFWFNPQDYAQMGTVIDS